MGAGIHGGFGSGTAGSNPPISRNGDVRYNQKKTVGYLLNENHPVGGAKARFWKNVLGYTKENARLFHKNIVESIKGKMPIKTEHSKFGTKHTYHTTLMGKSGASVSANVVVVVQRDNKRITYKVVTVYPDKKERRL